MSVIKRLENSISKHEEQTPSGRVKVISTSSREKRKKKKKKKKWNFGYFYSRNSILALQ